VSGVQFSLYGSATDRTTAKMQRINVEMDDGENRSSLAWAV
jgi:hypothetical protein